MNTRLQASSKYISPLTFRIVPRGLLQRKCACGGTPGPGGECEECRKKRLQRKVTQPSTLNHQHSEVPPIVHDVLRSPGQQLDAETRAFMEPRFGHDFHNVRVHADAHAADSARAVNSLAYTAGRDVVFGVGRYAPATSEGRRLMAHELAHVVQQSRQPAAALQGLTLSGKGDLAEREADSVAATVASGAFVSSITQVPTQGTLQAELAPDAGAPDAGVADAGVAEGGTADASAGSADAGTSPAAVCGPDITTSLTTMLGTVEPWFRGLTGFQQSRSCAALGPGGFLVGVNPAMAWDTRELFLPNTGWLDAYFRRSSCGSPRDPGCDTDPQRHLCETAGTCGNSVVVDGKCMLAGTANYALFGKMCRLCHDYTGRWNRWDMRAIIGVWKTIDWDDSTPPKEVASAAYDGAFPTVPAAAENRGTCTGRCGVTHGGTFDFIWEPYRPR